MIELQAQFEVMNINIYDCDERMTKPLESLILHLKDSLLSLLT